MKMRPMLPTPPIPEIAPAPLSYRSQAMDRALAAQAAALLKRKRKPGQEQRQKMRDAGQAGAESRPSGADSRRRAADNAGAPLDGLPFGRVNRLA
jgi:hypothetical protein